MVRLDDRQDNKIAEEYHYNLTLLKEEHTSQGHLRYFFHYAKY